MKKKILITILLLNLLLHTSIITAEEDIEIIITKNLTEETKEQTQITKIRGIQGIQTKTTTTKETLQENIKELEKENNVDIEIKRSYSSIEAVSATINEEELKTLQENNNDMHIHIQKARTVYASLDNSIQQIRGNDSARLQLNNINMTGKHETVCVIDTGVNYSHEALGGCYGNNSANSNCTVIGGWDYVNDDWDPIDDEGHGTHVTGIIASNNSTYRGIAPGTKIIAIKALDDTGTGTETDIIAGVDWCVNNATTFNISVITMSLSDCTNYTTACDSNYAAWAASVNAAAAKNISVIASAGNGPFGGCSSSGISSTAGPAAPACFSNVTSAGGVNDTDEIHPPWQRGGLFQLLAPGYTIRSAALTGGFNVRSGTSMAAPHLAGVFAIAQQLSQTQNDRYLSRQELENTFNNTGLIINDSFGTTENYTRINAYEGLLSMDETGPSITLTNPNNNSRDLDFNQSFTCSFNDWQLQNMTFYLWNSTGLYHNESADITGTNNSTTINLTNIPQGTYTWNCQGQDTKNNRAFHTNNHTLNTGGVNVTLISPVDDQRNKTMQHNFTCNTSTDTITSLTNITFKLWNNTGTLLYNETINITGENNQSTYNYSFNQEGNYTWNCEAYNNESENNTAEQNYTIQLDNSTTQINNVSSSSNTNSITITWTTTENTNHSIKGNLNNTNNSYKQNHSVTISSLSSSTTYEYNITACDLHGNCNTSNTFNETTTTAPSSGSGGGGGGGSSNKKTTTTTTTTTTLSTQELIKGTRTTLQEKEQINFTIAQEKHSLTINKLHEEKNQIEITLQSKPITLNLTLNKPLKINLTTKNYYDTLIILQQLNKETQKATIYLQAISEKITKTTTNDETNNTEKEENTKTKNEKEEEKNNKINNTALTTITILLLIFATKLYHNKRKKEKRKKTLEHIRKKTHTNKQHNHQHTNHKEQHQRHKHQEEHKKHTQHTHKTKHEQQQDKH